jgi:hypothetical protein
MSDDHQLDHLRREIINLCNEVVDAAQSLAAAERRMRAAVLDAHRRTEAIEQVYKQLRRIVIASGTIAGMLMGVERKQRKKGLPPVPKIDRAPLRDRLNIEDDSTILGARDIRHSFEHLDERVEEAGPHLIDLNIGPVDSIDATIMMLDPSTARLRNHDPASGYLTFGPDSINIHVLIDAVTELRDRARQVNFAAGA